MAMAKLKIRVGPNCVMRASNTVVIVDEGDDAREELVFEVARTVATDIEVTVGDITMTLAAWMDPDHWADDWVLKLGVDHDDVPGAVDELLAKALEA